MDLELAGKNIIVTGGSRGIGFAIARAFAQEGANVSICARSTNPLTAADTALKKYGTTFLLNASTETLANRIHNPTKRPLLTNSENLHLSLEKIWVERKRLYKNSAHHTIETDNLNPVQVLDEILNLLEVPFENN